MLYAPHILLKRIIIPAETDEFDRPLPGTGGEKWERVCPCRCDDNTTKEFRSENGRVYRPAYHVVCDGKTELNAGDYVRCMDGEAIRGEGEVYIMKSTNYLNYTEIWI